MYLHFFSSTSESIQQSVSGRSSQYSGSFDQDAQFVGHVSINTSCTLFPDSIKCRQVADVEKWHRMYLEVREASIQLIFNRIELF